MVKLHKLEYGSALTQAQIQSVMESTSYSKIPVDVKSTLGSELSGSDIDFTLSGTQSHLLQEHIG